MAERLPLVPALAAVLLGVLGASCADPPPPEPFQVYVRVEGDPSQPISGAVISRGGQTLGTTGEDGRTLLKIPGIEGEVVDVAVACPDGYAPPKGPLNVRLTRLADKSKVPEYSVACPPSLRRVVVAIRAENGPQLPVLYLNKPITKTDDSGAAHFALEVSPGTQFQVVLDTSGRKDLKPQMPAKIFVVAHQDDILVFDHKFEVERKKVFVAAKPHIPTALGPKRVEF